MDLYTVQQQLAKLQMQLERSHEQYNIMSQMRERSEEELALLNADETLSELPMDELPGYPTCMDLEVPHLRKVPVPSDTLRT